MGNEKAFIVEANLNKEFLDRASEIVVDFMNKIESIRKICDCHSEFGYNLGTLAYGISLAMDNVIGGSVVRISFLTGFLACLKKDGLEFKFLKKMSKEESDIVKNEIDKRKKSNLN